MRTQEIISLPTPAEQSIRGLYANENLALSTPAVIFAHGLGSTRGGEKATAIADECARRGWAFAAFDFHGHGDSDGTMLDLRGSRLLDDLGAIAQFLKERGHQTIFLIGSSMGGWASTWFAALHPTSIKACALIAPSFRFLEWQRLNEATRKQWQNNGRLRIVNEWIDLELEYGLHAEANDYPIAKLCERFATPCLLFHGMQDDTVPYAGSIEFAEQCAATDLRLYLIKNGDHRLNTHKEFLARTACDFFEETLAESWD